MCADKFTDTLQLIKNDVSLQDYFFNKLATASNPIEWLMPLRDAGYFNPQNNPKPQKVPNKEDYYTVPYWNILDALVNMAVINEANPDDGISATLLNIVDSIIEYRDTDERIDNFRTDWKLVEAISHFPIQYIGEQHIQFIKNILRPDTNISLIDREIGSLLLPKLIDGKAVKLILNLLDIILDYRKADKGYGYEIKPVIDKYYLKKALDKNKKGIGEICPLESACIALSKIKEILADDSSHFSYSSIPAIEDHEQNSSPDKYDFQIVSFVRDMLKAADANRIESLISDMIHDEHEIIKRLAYHSINYHYSELYRLFWSIPKNPIGGIINHEVYELLRNHCHSFVKSQIDIVLSWIETQHIYFSEQVAGNAEKEAAVAAYCKKEWLHAIIGSGDDEVMRRYNEYDAINNATIDHPGFSYWSYGVRTITTISPLDENDFKKMDNEAIVAYVNGYKEPKRAWEGTTQINLASSIRGFVSNDPERFSVNLTPFLALPPKYLLELLLGLEEAWRNNKNFTWNELLSFMTQIADDASFWAQEETEKSRDYKRWIINAIADLIHEGTKNDKHAFPPELLAKAESLILLLLKNAKSDLSDSSDLVSSAMNSTKGKIYISAINLSLRHARIYCADKDVRWTEPIKTEFTNRLDKNIEPDLVFSTIIGVYLVNLLYLDKNWVIENIDRIFDKNSDSHWKAAFAGHISIQSNVHEEVYYLLRDGGHYKKGLTSELKDKHISTKLVQIISVGYLAGWDKFSDTNGLLWQVLESDNSEYLSALVNFIGTYRDKDDGDFINKVKPLWNVIIEKISLKAEESAYRIIASNLARWLSKIDTIDEDIVSWLKVSTRFIEENWNSSSFVKDLHKHVTKTPKLVGQLYLAMLEADNYPVFQEEDVIAIVQSLYDSNETETASIICNYYLKKGIYFLKETFRKNHNP